MMKVSLFTPISYERPCSLAEKSLAVISNYFYLGGDRAIVVKGNEARMESEKRSWSSITLKVASYVLLFPLTITLVAVNLGLRYRHKITVITPLPPRSESTQMRDSTEPRKTPVPIFLSPVKASSLVAEPQAVASPSPIPKQSAEPVLEKFEEEPLPRFHSVATKTVQPVASSRLSEEVFLPFSINLSDNPLLVISSAKEMHAKAREIVSEVLDGHVSHRLQIPCLGFLRTRVPQAVQFVEELRADLDVMATRFPDLFDLCPKKTEEVRDGLTIRRYNNGVIEEVQSKDSNWNGWNGRRIYPNGKIEKGDFNNFFFAKGTCVEHQTTTYRMLLPLVGSYTLDRHLMYAEIEGEKRLIVVQRKPDGYEYDRIQVEEELIPTLANILQDTGDVEENNLREILSESINCEAFVRFLFEKNLIFSIKAYPFQSLLKIIREKGIAINVRQRHPETNESLLDRYSGEVRILRGLLSIDPTLAQRSEKGESAFVHALMKGNKKGASVLQASMEEQKIALFPREILFKKVAFSEGEVTLEELKTLSREDQEIVYRLANTYTQLNVVRTMRVLGFGRREEVLMREGPSIFGYNMDALERYEYLQDFLKNLRSQKLLLSESEFRSLPRQNYVEKGADIGRILGRDYIERKARELGLQHVKVPKKMIVMDDTANLQLQIDRRCNIVAEGGVRVYAERIQSCSRRITPEEVTELLRLFEATGFSDIHWGNVIVAADGVYIIDTEFTNFWIMSFYFEHGRQYAEMAKIVHALPVDRQSPFIDDLNAKIRTYREKEDALTEQRKLHFKAEQEALQKTGFICYQSFPFSAGELLS